MDRFTALLMMVRSCDTPLATITGYSNLSQTLPNKIRNLTTKIQNCNKYVVDITQYLTQHISGSDLLDFKIISCCIFIIILCFHHTLPWIYLKDLLLYKGSWISNDNVYITLFNMVCVMVIQTWAWHHVFFTLGRSPGPKPQYVVCCLTLIGWSSKILCHIHW